MKPLDPPFLPPPGGHNRQSPMASPRSAPSSTRLRAERLRIAEQAARRMLSAYPDYGKASPEYLLSVTELLATFEPWLMEKLSNHRTGIPAKAEFLPTLAVIGEMADRLLADQVKFERYASLQDRKPQQPAVLGASYVPFPRLWAAFADDMEVLMYRPFETLDAADRALAMHGKEAAFRILNTGKDAA